ncbi:hypothetical protein ACLOJK_017385 [Asimina triloba]
MKYSFLILLSSVEEIPQTKVNRVCRARLRSLLQIDIPGPERFDVSAAWSQKTHVAGGDLARNSSVLTFPLCLFPLFSEYAHPDSDLPLFTISMLDGPTNGSWDRSMKSAEGGRGVEASADLCFGLPFGVCYFGERETETETDREQLESLSFGVG